MRLADVDKILKDLENNPNLDFSLCDACWGEIYTTIDNAQIIIECGITSDGLPLMDLRPKPKVEQPTGDWGKWIISEIRCPNCLEYFDPEWYSAEELKKCPNCRAKMKGDDEE